MKPIAPLLILSAVVALTGCVSTQATRLTADRRAPVAESDVHVYLADDELPSGCERIALIHASANVDWTDQQQMIAAARRRAGKTGANAIVINSLRDPKLGTRVAAEVLGLPAERKGQMLAYHCPAPANGGSTAARTSALPGEHRRAGAAGHRISAQ